MVLPAATETVSVAGEGLTLQVMSADSTSVTGELFCGRRTAPVDLVLPAMSVVQMSRMGSVKSTSGREIQDSQCAETL